jgi:hypothetical protein
MTTRFDDDEKGLQLSLAVERQSTSKFSVDCLLRGRQNSQINHTGPGSLDEDKGSKIAVAGDENSTLIPRGAQQINVFRSGHAELSSRYHIVAQISEELHRDGVNILIDEESHGREYYGAVARWMSSAANTSIAY